MSNGYLIAASADVEAAREIGAGFGLEVIDALSVGDAEATVTELANAANVGLLLSIAAASDAGFVSLVQAITHRVNRVQLILVEAEAHAAFPSLPTMWPAMSLDDARARASAIALQRQESEGATDGEPPHAHPLPPVEPPPIRERPEESINETQEEAASEEPALDGAPLDDLGQVPAGSSDDVPSEVETAAPEEPSPSDDLLGGEERARGIDIEPRAEDSFGAGAPEPAPQEQPAVAAAPPPAATMPEPPPAVSAPTPPPSAEPPEAPPPQAPAPIPAPKRAEAPDGARSRAAPGAGGAAPTAPADATAFAPKKLRRGEAELVRIVVHQPKDLNDVIKAAKKIDPRADPAPSGVSIGDVAIGASIGVALEVRGATADGTVQRRTWTSEPIDFSFAVEADANVKQVVLLARVFVNDAQIGVLAFTRNVSGPAKKPHSPGDRVRLKRHKRVFLSYSSKDREIVSQIATAYQMAGVEHFWDRASLKSGEEWHPRLRREIDRADLFHLCWSKAAAESEWVQREAEHALTRRKKNSGKPDITVQMLDGPPWAPHPAELDTINFDDFVRAAIVGYARGDGS
jgi:hypothetical protein